MGVEVEIWGGPHDGKVYAVESIHHHLRMVKHNDIVTHAWSEDAPETEPLTILFIDLPIMLTPNGWKAIWPKGES